MMTSGRSPIEPSATTHSPFRRDHPLAGMTPDGMAMEVGKKTDLRPERLRPERLGSPAGGQALPPFDLDLFQLHPPLAGQMGWRHGAVLQRAPRSRDRSQVHGRMGSGGSLLQHLRSSTSSSRQPLVGAPGGSPCCLAEPSEPPHVRHRAQRVLRQRRAALRRTGWFRSITMPMRRVASSPSSSRVNRSHPTPRNHRDDGRARSVQARAAPGRPPRHVQGARLADRPQRSL